MVGVLTVYNIVEQLRKNFLLISNKLFDLVSKQKMFITAVIYVLKEEFLHELYDFKERMVVG